MTSNRFICLRDINTSKDPNLIEVDQVWIACKGEVFVIEDGDDKFISKTKSMNLIDKEEAYLRDWYIYAAHSKYNLKMLIEKKYILFF